MNSRPGVNILEPIKPFYRPFTDKKLVICIATRTISSKNIFTNGLYQNILFLYKLFRCLGHQSILLIHEMPCHDNADILLDDSYEVLTPEQVINMSVVFDLYIEIGMSTNIAFIHKLRENNTKIIKLYLGNALNIDTEMIVDGNNVSFPHHIYSELDEIWTSPHYTINSDYLCGIYRLPISCGKIVPYIWDSSIIDRGEKVVWKQPTGGWQNMDIVITEPNISYQKCALVPLLLANMFYLREPSWKGRVVLMNSNRLKSNVHLQAGLLSDLDIFRSNRVIFKDRNDILAILKDNSSAVFILHQFNNEFNYMTLELMWRGWPVLHNTDTWKEFGYYWNDTRCDEALNLLKRIMKEHTGNEGRCAADAKLLAWSYSMYNPEVQRAWQSILLGA